MLSPFLREKKKKRRFPSLSLLLPSFFFSFSVQCILCDLRIDENLPDRIVCRKSSCMPSRRTLHPAFGKADAFAYLGYPLESGNGFRSG